MRALSAYIIVCACQYNYHNWFDYCVRQEKTVSLMYLITRPGGDFEKSAEDIVATALVLLQAISDFSNSDTKTKVRG